MARHIREVSILGPWIGAGRRLIGSGDGTQQAIEDPDVSLLVWGNPAYEELLSERSSGTRIGRSAGAGNPEVMFEPSGSLFAQES